MVDVNFDDPWDAWDACLKACKSEADCKWFSYNKNLRLCMLFKSCEMLDENNLGYVSGEVKCEYAQSKFIICKSNSRI